MMMLIGNDNDVDWKWWLYSNRMISNSSHCNINVQLLSCFFLVTTFPMWFCQPEDFPRSAAPRAPMPPCGMCPLGKPKCIIYSCMYTYIIQLCTIYTCMFIYIYIHTYIYIYIHTYIYIYVYVYIHIHIYNTVYIYIYTYTYIYIFMYICIYIYVYVCIYICVYIYMYTQYIYIYIYIHT